MTGLAAGLRDVDPAFERLGLLVGLLKREEAGVTVEPRWFADPLASLGRVRSQLRALLEELLGEPRKHEGKSWYALRMPGEEQVEDPSAKASTTDLGFYLALDPHVEAEAAVAGPAAGNGTIAGVGLRLARKRPLELAFHVFIPLVDLASGDLATGTGAHPLRLGVDLAAADASLGEGDFSFQSLSFGTSLFFDGKTPDVSLLLKGLRLPGEDAPLGLDLLAQIDSLRDDPKAWIERLLKLLLQLLWERSKGEEAETAEAMAANLQLVLRLGDSTGAAVPPLDWARLVAGPGEELSRWLAAIAADREALGSWLRGWTGLLRGADFGRAEVAGEGTRDEPYLLPLAEAARGHELALALAVEEAAGLTRLTPGLRVTSRRYDLADRAVAHLRGALDAARLSLSANAAAKLEVPCPRFTLELVVASPAGGPLFELTDAGQPEKSFRLGEIHAGLSVAHDEDGFRLHPRLCLSRTLVGAATEPAEYELIDAVLSGDGDGARSAFHSLAEALLRAWSLHQLPETPTAGGDRAEPPPEGRELARLRELMADDLHDRIAWNSPRYRKLFEVLLGLAEISIPEGQPLDVEEITGRVIAKIDELVGWLETSSGTDMLRGLASGFEAGKLDGLLEWLFEDAVPGFAPVGPGHFRMAPSAGLKIEAGCLAAKRFGMKLLLEHTVGWLRAAAEAGAAIDLDSGAPDFRASASAGIDLERLHVPELLPGPQLEAALELGTEGPPCALGFWPLGKPADAGDGFEMALLPKPALYLGNDPKDAEEWLRKLAAKLLRPMVDALVLSREAVTGVLGETYPETQVSAGLVLKNWGLLCREEGDERYRLAAPAKLETLRPAGLLAETCKALAAAADHGGLPIFPLPRPGRKAGKGVYVVRRDRSYGLRVFATDLALGKQVVLQLGKPLAGAERWLENAGGPRDREPGVIVRLVQDDGGARFAPGLEMVDVGFDLAGEKPAGGGEPKPLISGRMKVGAVQPRLYLAAPAAGDPASFALGAAVHLEGLALRLGPPAGESAKNPVAGELLGSGGGAEEPLSPSFAATLGFVAGGKLWGELHSDADPSSDGKIWFPVRRPVGPLYCRQIGLGFKSEDAALLVGYDGKVSVGPLEIDLLDLSVGIPLATPTDVGNYHLDLGGLAVSLDKPPIEVSGSLFKNPGKTPAEYAGSAVIKAEAFTISGFGVFGSAQGAPSFFLFAMLDKDLGGPPIFHVTGLAAGFGYNRGLRLPAVSDVEEFPLVKGARDPGYFGGSQNPDEGPQQALKKLDPYLPAKRGEIWLAAGVRFTSFEIIESVALLAVNFASQTVISLLGVSELTVPKGAKRDAAIAYAKLLLRAELIPEAGTLKVDGLLGTDSFIFHRNCHLTGGFAFYVWFAGDHEGDFVVTLGGYHPRFLRPPHYPEVPRLDVNWRISAECSVSGELYWALTPSCLMAGGKLAARFASGGLKAWFDAYADFLIYWQPFHYEIDVGVRVGVSYTFSVNLGFVRVSTTLKVELAAELSLWGPPFGGEARVTWFVISFTVPLGDGEKTLPEPLTWQKFRDLCLPAGLVSIQITAGLVRQEQLEARPWPVVNAHQLRVHTRSAVPSTRLWVAGGEPHEMDAETRRQVGIRPMNGPPGRPYECTYEVAVEPLAGTPDPFGAEPRPRFRSEAVRQGVPHALWSSEQIGKLEAEAKVIPEVPTGLRFGLEIPDPFHALPALRDAAGRPLPGIPLRRFQYEEIPKRIGWREELRVPAAIGDPGTRTLMSTICEAGVDDVRRGILAALRLVTPQPLNEVRLETLSKTAHEVFQADPQMANLGQAHD